MVAVAAAGGQPQGGEKSVEAVDRAAADQGQRAVQSPMQGFQRHAQFARHMDRIGRLGDIQKGAVDIEEQRTRLPALAQPLFEQGVRQSVITQGNGRADWSLHHRTRHGPFSS
ncbi:hypothetical protein D9M70_643820 [compost metagenome]